MMNPTRIPQKYVEQVQEENNYIY